MTHPRDILHAEIAKLRAENEELKERVRQYEAKERPVQFPRSWRLTVIEEGILRCLYRSAGRTLSDSSIVLDVWGDERAIALDTLKVHIWKLRIKIEGLHIEVKNDWGRGYYLTKRDAAIVRTALMQEAA